MKQALISGQLGWSLALVLAKVAAADDEAEWLEQAETLTVRELSDFSARQDGPASAHENGSTLGIVIS
jgi:hypothetical protein